MEILRGESITVLFLEIKDTNMINKSPEQLDMFLYDDNLDYVLVPGKIKKKFLKSNLHPIVYHHLKNKKNEFLFYGEA